MKRDTIRKVTALLLAAVISAALAACGNAGSQTAKVTVTYDSQWDSSIEAASTQTQWTKTYEGAEAAELVALFESFSYDGPTCECLPAYILETETGESYGYTPDEYVRQDDGQNLLTDLTDDEVKQLQELFDVIKAKGEDVPQE